MGLFFKILHENPFLFLSQYLKGHITVRTEDEISRFFTSFQGDIGIADRAFKIFRHPSSPLFSIRISIVEVPEKIKRFFFSFFELLYKISTGN